MAVPDYQTFMLPVLRYAGSRRQEEISSGELLDAMAKEFNLSETDRTELLPSGSQFTFANRVGWACTYMKKAALLTSPRRAHFQITERGLKVLVDKPAKITSAFLKQFPEFLAFQAKSKATQADDKDSDVSEDASPSRTPLEILETSYQTLRRELASEILQRVKECSPAFFERLVVELLVKMGYGGSRSDAGRAMGKSGDGGIDGIIKEDKLGLDVIYLQAKRWDTNVVGRPQVQQFAGALAGHAATKGVFITTSHFSDEAREFVARIGSKIVLIDGDELAELMIDHNVGVTAAVTYEVKRVDSDYFAEEA